jgi:hypothetical protein
LKITLFPLLGESLTVPHRRLAAVRPDLSSVGLYDCGNLHAAISCAGDEPQHFNASHLNQVRVLNGG